MSSRPGKDSVSKNMVEGLTSDLYRHRLKLVYYPHTYREGFQRYGGGGIFYNVCCRNTLKALKATLFCYQPVSSGRSSNWSFTLGSATLLLASAVGSLFTKFSVIFLFLQSLLLGMYTEHGSAETGDLAVTERSFANT